MQFLQDLIKRAKIWQRSMLNFLEKHFNNSRMPSYFGGLPKKPTCSVVQVPKLDELKEQLWKKGIFLSQEKADYIVQRYQAVLALQTLSIGYLAQLWAKSATVTAV